MVRALHVLRNETITLRETDYRHRLAREPAAGAIELFA
jgi:hypothetical protein